MISYNVYISFVLRFVQIELMYKNAGLSGYVKLRVEDAVIFDKHCSYLQGKCDDH
jgi:hypothetical protein